MKVLSELIYVELSEAGYQVVSATNEDGAYLLFENDTILGFVLFFPDPTSLRERWRPTSQRLISTFQFALRRAEAKSWNTYLVLLSESPGDIADHVTLGMIEEDLAGTRKIARAGITNGNEAHSALLPLVDIQNAPQLGTIDMAVEIRIRTPELPRDLVDAFLNKANNKSMLDLLERQE